MRRDGIQMVDTAHFRTGYWDVGQGHPVLLLHGSGPGVTAWANWQGLFSYLSPRYRVLALDLAGFGASRPSESPEYTMKQWLLQITEFLRALNIDKVYCVGNSFGGALGLALAAGFPQVVGRLVLMGSVGTVFPLTRGLEKVWGYEGKNVEDMAELMDCFVYDKGRLTPELVAARYEAASDPLLQDNYRQMFRRPFETQIAMMATPDEEIAKITVPVLLIHGRDDQVIPPAVSYHLLSLISNSQLHVFGQCGHWTQIERAREFAELVGLFFAQPDQ